MPTGTEGDVTQNQGSPEGQGEQGQAATPAIDYSKVDWAKFDWSKVPATAVPESLVKETDAGKKLLQETIERRQKISQLKAALEEKAPATDSKGTTPTASVTPKPDDSMPEWAKQLMGQVETIRTNTETQAVKGLIEAALVANKLPETAKSFITGKTADEINAQAVELAKMITPKDTTNPGNPGNLAEGDIQSRAKAIINSRINGAVPVSEKGHSIFDTKIQHIK